MRYHEIINEADQPDLAAELRAIRKEFQTLLDNTPDKVKDHELLLRFYTERVRPIEDRLGLAQKQERVAAQHEKRKQLQVPDGFSSEVLYHGSNSDFVKFDRSKGRTAEHIYTSPDIDTAKSYGEYLYQVFGRQKPQADLSAEASNVALIRRIHRAGGFKQSFNLSVKELSELVDEGQLYQSEGNSNLQDAVIDTCFSLKFRSVRLTDPMPGGGFSDSVIFDHADDLVIIKKIDV